jgi:hypothetical protein
MVMRNSRRDDLMVTMGARAAYMECIGNITLPKGVDGEYELSVFVAEKVDHYIDNEIDEAFDIYIEEALEKKYGNGEDEFSLEAIAYNAIGFMLCESEMSVEEVCEYIGCTKEDLEEYGLLD